MFHTYKLILHKTYYDKGFFNLGISVEKHIRSDSGEITIILGESKKEILGKISREANLNHSPRIFGGLELRNWVQNNYQLKDLIEVVILSPTKVWLRNL